MADTGSTQIPSSGQPLERRKKDGTYSKMRSHAGNTPVLPQTKLCPFCPAKFTRTTHLNRHLRNHTNERIHKCDLCEAQFTRSDLLSRHRRSCSHQASNIRRRSCVPCTQSKVKCDRDLPCSKCSSRGKECIYAPITKRVHKSHHLATGSLPQATHTQDSQFTATTSSAPILPNDPSVSAPPSLADQHSESSCGYSSATSSEMSWQIPTNSHLVSLYNHDMFEPFFNDLFSAMDNSLQSSSLDVSASGTRSSDDDHDWGYSIIGQTDTTTQLVSRENIPAFISPSAYFPPATSNIKETPATVMEISAEPGDHDKHHFLRLFYSAFVEQVPVVHAPSFGPEGKPPFLINAMQACGAIFVKSKTAATFITTTLRVSRKFILEEFSKDSLTIEGQLDLILTVVLLHTLGLFHEEAEERATSGLYHGMLITMIRRVNFISRIAGWSANEDSPLSLEERWRHWAWHEMSNRALLLSYLQDTSQCIYFTVPSSYHIAELIFNLPCDDKLWRAQSASEWWEELHRGSRYGNAHERLNCPTLPSILQLVFEPRTTQMKAISYFAHWAVIHGIVGRLFTLCTNGPLFLRNSLGTLDQEFHGIQYALHNWLQWWMKRPEIIDSNPPEEAEPPFMRNPLPFYWLGQVALLAYQENLPPFDAQVYSSRELRMEVRFWQVKKWIRHIRSFLAGAHRLSPTILWDELMNIRLQSWQVDLQLPANDDPHGLLGFFVQ
ncbi:hypothetical protein J3R30DRAFT_3283945 [Lentinula aciculospora]|uniref:Zn(2)-C6 fungal-type domain-containing protein n=1 Tax=Lentinula aciculospora TaxID=153920 RepID=A0A9W9AJ13_9AGAR|nr:hypothetical protein J3R30DRAFT_3283945 [Lentinula aciculospora]